MSSEVYETAGAHNIVITVDIITWRNHSKMKRI